MSRRNVEDIYKLSPVQQGILFHAVYDPSAVAYHEQFFQDVEADWLDRDLFVAAWRKLLDRHPVLRTGFVWEGVEEPVQVVHERVEPDLVEEDLSSTPAGERAAVWARFMEDDRRRGFDLAKPPLARLSLVDLEGGELRVLVSYHHLLLDGWSASVVLRELFAIYTALVAGEEPRLGERRPFRDYIAWLRRQDLSEAEAYWARLLTGFDEPTPICDLGADAPAERGAARYGEVSLVFSEETTGALGRVARANRVTLNTLVQAAWAWTLGRISGRGDVVFGATVSGRPPGLRGVETMVGCFINTLPVRVPIPGGGKVTPWLEGIQAELNELRRFEHSPLVDVRRWGGVPADRALFDSILVFENFDPDAEEGEGRVARFQRTNYPLTMIAFPERRLELQATWERHRFRPSTVDRLVDTLRTTLEALSAGPDRVDELPTAPPAELHRVLVEWNDTGRDWGADRDALLHELIVRSAERHRDEVAVAIGDRELTYAQLDEQTRRLAHHLRGVGVGPEVPVGMAAERSLELVVGLVAVLRAGGYYVPLDPSYPDERLAFMVADSGVPVLLTQERIAGDLPASDAEVVLLDGGAWREAPATAPPARVDPEQLAYTIYTSGSTGRPKGAMNAHRGIVNRLLWMQEQYRLGPTDRVLQKTPFSFDVSVWELFWPLLAGARLVLARPGGHQDPDYLVDLVRSAGITTMHFVPSMLQVFLEAREVEECGSLRRVIASGEALPPDLVARYYDRLRAPLHNLYGPTEAAIDVTYWPTAAGDASGVVPIGRPVANTRVVVLDSASRPLPAGAAGELHLGGVQLGRGYLGRPGLTADRFVPDPLVDLEDAPGAGGRLYRTGDLARTLPDGAVEFLGRVDHQVKVRGFRIELGEIEAALSRHRRVRETVVLAREHGAGDTRLVAYVVPAGEEAPELDELRASLGESLPEYMLPAALVVLDEMPLTPNGKVDRKALPEPDDGAGAGAFEPPTTPTEEALARIWRTVLGVERVGRRDDFFRLGGHSLLGTRLLWRVRDELEADLPLRTLFENPSLAAMAAVIDRATGCAADDAPPIRVLPAEEKRAGVPLSFAQERLWFVHRMEPESSAYSVPGAVRLRGTLDPGGLARTLSALVERHETLRTVFTTRGGDAVQRVLEPEPAPLPVLDLGRLPAAVREEELRRVAVRLAEQPFDLERGPLLRARLARLASKEGSKKGSEKGAEEHAVLVSMHHIVSDAWSLGVFVRDLVALYGAVAARRPSPLTPLPVQYADYAVWQREWLEGEVLDGQLAYWKERLAGSDGVLDLPTDRPRPPVQTMRGATLSSRLPEGLAADLHGLARSEGASLFMVCLALFDALLVRLTGQDDVTVGTTIANRTRTETADLVGFFVNSLALRTDLAGSDPSVRDLVRRVREETLEAYDHQDLPFERLVQEVRPERDLSRSPLFQVVLQLQNAPPEGPALPGLEVEPVTMDTRTSKFDLVVNLQETDGGMGILWRYKSDLFAPTTIRRLADRFAILAAGAVADPERSLSALPVLSAAERHQLAVERPALPPHAAAAPDRPIHRLFEERAAAAPGAPALTCDGKTLSYGELDRRANRLAWRLRELGVGPEVPVALCVERSPALVEAILGVLKAGGAYVPLDPAYPSERLAFTLEDCRAPVVVTEEGLRSALPDESGEVAVLYLDADPEDSRPEEPGAPPPASVGPDHLAYVIYTSGSTGRPKGVPVTHGNVVRLLRTTEPWFGFGPEDVWALFHSYAFDFSVWELWGTLAYGGRLVVVPHRVSRSPEAFHELLRSEGVTVLNQTPSAFRQLVRADLGAPEITTLRTVIFGGEALELESLFPWFRRYGSDRPRLVNMYGITETTVHVTYRPIDAGDVERAPGSVIGVPIPDLRIHLLDPALRPVPIGVAGEIHVAGAGLARGYLARRSLTAERFVPDPFAPGPEEAGGRLYRSGDLARLLPGGDLEYLGRIDHQVKIRGFRIELGEIESAFASHPEVAEAVVVARGEAEERRLVAYVVPTSAAETPAIAALRGHVTERLPDHMVPAATVLLDALPLTPSGKVDRRALPEPDAERPELAQEMVAPRDALEEAVAALWREALKLEEVGVHDDFFDLGGSSLVGAVLINELQQALGEIVQVVVIFDHPTVADLAAYLREQHPVGVARLLGEEVTAGPGEGTEDDEEVRPVDATMVDEARELVAGMERFTVAEAPAEPKNPPMAFVLSAPRSGSTLLRVMLGGHPDLFAPPELELLSFATMADRAAAFTGRNAFWLEGAIRAVMELEGCDADSARKRIDAAEEEGLSTAVFYRRLQESLAGRLLVDKTPSYALQEEILRRAEEDFGGARYIHLVRHPYGMIRSFEEAKLDQIFFPADHSFGRRRLAELIWLISERNIRAFLATVPAERRHPVRFEDLVRRPEETLGALCDFLGVDYRPEMADPYGEPSGRMTDGIHEQSRMLGDVKFHQHRGVDPAAADRWRADVRRDFLGAPTLEAAARHGYGPLERTLPPIEPLDRAPGEPLPVSFAQERLWFLEQLDPGNHTYNIPTAVRLVGRLDLERLEEALTGAARRQASLRTTFTTTGDGRPAQVIHAPRPVPVPMVDLSGLAEAAREQAARRAAAREARRPFDLEAGPLVRVLVLRLAPEEHAVLLTMHHIASDGWSMGVLIREIAAGYAARVTGDEPDPPELPVQYADYAAWQRETVTDRMLEDQLAYWRRRLADAPVLQLPTDRPRPSVQTFRGSTLPFRFEPALADALARVGREAGATRYATMLAALQVLLGRWAGQDDLTVGSPFANRNRSEIEGLIGFFVNTLVLRGDLADDPTFRELLERTRTASVEAFAHQDVPFERVVQEVQPERSLSVPPLFQAMLTLQDRPPAVAADLPGLRLEPQEADAAISKFDLTLTLVETGGRLGGQWVWNTDLFDRATVERIGRSLEALLGGLAETPDRRIGELPLLPEAERQQILVDWNRSVVDYPTAPETAPELLASQASATPDAVAVVADGARWTYGELDRRAAALARRLAGLGVGPETVVGVAAERGLEMVAGLIAVWKAGGAYLPLDPALPQDRLTFMLDDAGVDLVLTQEHLAGRVGEMSGRRRLLALDGPVDGSPDRSRNQNREADAEPVSPGPEAAAYVIYTSGSTGRPKGVVVSQGALANRLRYARAVDMGPDDAFLQKTTISFDVSLLEIFGPLVSGGRTVLALPGEEKDTRALTRRIARERVTQTSFPPTLLYALLEEEDFRRLDSLGTMITGGETVPPELPGRFYRHLDADLLNRYGPTEATVSVTSWRCRPGRRELTLPIGRATARAELYVLDRAFRPVPVGVPGELVLGGPSVARGYLGRPARTGEAFVPHPFADDLEEGRAGERLYRTGDLVRLRPDGALEFEGRIDTQVKIRGFRVELGEIEAVLARQEGVREVVVVARGRGADTSPVAYLVPEAGAAIEPEWLRQVAAEALPAYMVPSAFVALGALPLGPTGKVDTEALPDPGRTAPEAGADGSEPPSGPVEEIVAGVWSEVLDVSRIGRDDDFFDLGGHSLIATRVVSRLRRSFGVDVPLRALFEAPTVRGLAAAVEAGRREGEAPAVPRVSRPEEGAAEMPLSFAQERLWFLDRMDAESAAYNLLAAIRLHGRLRVDALERSLAEMVRRHETLRTVFATVDGEPVQRVLPSTADRRSRIAEVDLTMLPSEEAEAAADAMARRDALRRFDLAAGPVLRATLIRVAPDDHLFLVSMHHIVSDGWSLGVFVRELSALYGAFVRGETSPLPDLPVQYGDFAAWQRDWLRGEALERQLDYWRDRLEDATSVLDLPTDRPRPPVQSFRGSTLEIAVPAEVTGRLRELARGHGATLFMVCMAAFQALLARYSGQGDLTVGTTIANRNRPEIEGLIGFFVNVLALRGELGDDPSFAELLERVRAESLGAHDHQDLPFEKLVEELQPHRDLSRSPLFQVLMQLQNAPVGQLELPDLTVRPVMRDTATAKFDLILNLAERGGALRGQWRYKTDLFDRTTVARMGRHLARLLTAVAGKPDLPVSALPMLAPAERHQVVCELAGGEESHPVSETLDAIFRWRAAERPDAVAVTCDGAALSYGELARRAGELARRLRGSGAGPDIPVGLCLNRSPDMVVAILGVLEAGMAYLPLDPAYPEERLELMVEDSGAPVVLVDAATAGRVPASGARVLRIDGDEGGGEGTGIAPDAAARPDDPAYVIYTSGSTGRPKGVPVTHANAVRLFTATDRWFGFDQRDVWTLFHSYAFDFSVWELWGALLHGARLAVVPRRVAQDPDAFRDLLARERVTFLSQTPSAFRQLVRADGARGDDDRLDDLRSVVFGGEALELESLAPWFDRYGDRRPELVNMYGITETTVHVTYRPIRRCDLEGARGSVIGRPIPDLTLHLLDPGAKPVPIGVAGEIHVGGAGVALGYLGRPALTAERFVPSSGARGGRLYRSGDLARRLPDGDLEYLGRIDHQVKVRGFRIELGEIESCLVSHPAVAEAVVVARRSGAGQGTGAGGEDLRLAAYVVPADGQLPTVAALREFVGESLPEYMIPSAVTALDAIPLTPNGKVDRKALPDPGSDRPELGREYVAPRDELESFLAELWRSSLGVDRVGGEDDFFDLGGNSLVGAVLVNKLQDALGEIVHVVVIFDCPTVASLAAYLREQHPEGVRRLLGDRTGVGPGAGDAEEEASPVEAEMLERVRSLVAGMDRFTVDGANDAPANRPAVFVLSPPRSGSTLLRVMLGGHPGLFAPPELELLSFDTMADRARVFTGRDAFWLEGALRAVMEAEGCDADEARRLVSEAEEEGWSTRRFYGWLQERLGDRLLVDKTPSYSLHPEVLARAERQFDGARYIHLVRHPYGMIRSFEEAKLDQIFFPAEHPFTRRRLAEMLWTVSQENIGRFLDGVPGERRLTVHFEDLVRHPERELRRICRLLGVDYHPAMAQPYGDPGARMTDGIHEQSRMLGDVKFHQHSGVDPAVADRWREHYRRDFLGAPTWEVAERMGLGGQRIERHLPPSVVALRPGDDRPPLFLVHPVSGDVHFYRDLARGLAPGQPVFGFQAPGIDAGEEPLETIEAMAERYVESLLAFQPDGPHLLAGSSMGGSIAYEMARRLAVRGVEPALVGLVDTPGPGQLPDRFRGAEVEATVLAYLLREPRAVNMEELEKRSPEERLEYMLAEAERAGRLPEGVGPDTLRRLVRVITTNQAAAIDYRPDPYGGRVTFFRAADGGERYDEPRETPWIPLVEGDLDVHVVPGNHLSMNLPPHAADLAAALQEAIDRALERHDPRPLAGTHG